MSAGAGPGPVDWLTLTSAELGIAMGNGKLGSEISTIFAFDATILPGRSIRTLFSVKPKGGWPRKPFKVRVPPSAHMLSISTLRNCGSKVPEAVE